MTFLHHLTTFKPKLVSQIEATVTIDNDPYMTLTVENIGPAHTVSLPSPSVTTENRTATSCATLRCVSKCRSKTAR